uniref:Uncharacterized protein n=1 Tax=Panagrolaimus sp. JU765 TaxID=591449 RepID=A0AC34RN16_9BILA
MGKFDGKVVIVTGSSSGIGQAVILAFSKEGASVVLHGTNGERIEETRKLLEQLGVSGAKLLIVQGDISDENVQDRLIEETVEKFGRIDVLINNAGLTKKDGTDYHSVESFDYVMKVNLRAPFRLTQLALPHLEKTKGNIINTSSIASTVKTFEHPMLTVYGMSKAALDTFTKYECARLAKKGVRINNINPGAFTTNIIQRGDPMFTPEQMAKMMEDGGKAMMKTTPVGRWGVPSEIAPIYVQLADNEVSSFITGACWIIDGGATCYAPNLI